MRDTFRRHLHAHKQQLRSSFNPQKKMTKKYPTKNLLTKKRSFLLLLGLLFNLTLMFSYIQFISPVYEYSGLTARELPLFLWFISTGISLAPLLWMPIDCNRASDYTLWILYLVIVNPLPTLAFLLSAGENQAESSIITIVSILFAFVLLDIIRRLKIFPLIRVPESKLIIMFWLPIITTCISFSVLALNNFQIDLSFDDVYIRRLHAREIVLGSSFMAYLMGTVQGASIPFCLAIGLYYRKVFFILVALLAVIAIFSLEGSKSSIFLPLLITFIFWLITKFQSHQGIILLGGLCLLLILSIIEEVTTDSIFLSALITRRILVMPSQLTSYYWEFFSHNPYVFFSDNLFSSFIPPRYSLPIPMVIGEIYFRNAETNANASIWPSAYAHFGYVGVIVSSIVGGLLLGIIDTIAQKTHFVFAGIICAVIGLIWSQGALHTSLLSNGVTASIALLLILPTSRASLVKSKSTHKYRFRNSYFVARTINSTLSFGKSDNI